jgi:hypothetical protein
MYEKKHCHKSDLPYLMTQNIITATKEKHRRRWQRCGYGVVCKWSTNIKKNKIKRDLLNQLTS